jgi:hypothetical protein
LSEVVFGNKAQVVKSILEASGIEVFIPDEHFLGVQPHYGIAQLMIAGCEACSETAPRFHSITFSIV